ncbi:MAG: hypothetical protein KatS3mg009_1738 [Acidimicrobiia bacterium]|nr:MAG: hypothetical protein KatS3mg009_1738 [Acidimicrobiia bacterium]
MGEAPGRVVALAARASGVTARAPSRTAPRPARGAPTARPGGVVDRPRLRRRLDAAAHAVLTVVCAPVGYGKRTLVRDWAARNGRATVVVVPGPDARWDPAILGARAREDARAGRPLLVVVEEFDAAPPRVVRWLARAVSSRDPGALRVVVTTRSRDAAAPLVTGAGGRAVEWLTAADLAFDAREARDLLEARAGRVVDAPVVESLHARTEGWAAGLVVAAEELRHADPERVVAGIRGVHHHLADLLRVEVLARVPPDSARFLVRTSVLETLSGPACDALTGGRGAALVLARLERGGVFTRRAGREPGAYEYHPIFRDVLRDELRLTEPELERTLLRRAAAYEERRGRPGDAVRYAAAAEDWEGVVGLVDRHGARSFVTGGVGEVLRWLDAVPAARAPAGTRLRKLVALSMAGEVSRARRELQVVERHTPGPGERLVEDVVKAAWALWGERPEEVIRSADAVMRGLEGPDAPPVPNLFGLTTPADVWVVAAVSRARASWYLGDVAAAREQLDAAARRRRAHALWRTNVWGALALVEAWAGRLRPASVHARQATALALRAGLLEHPAMADACLALARVARARGDFARADELLARIERSGSARPVARAIGAAERAAWHLVTGTPRLGLATLERARALGDPPAPPAVEGFLCAVESRLRLATGAVDHARLVLDARRGLPGLEVATVAAALAAGDVGVARSVLERWHPQPGEPRAVAERELWAATVDARGGDRRSALRRASAAMGVAEAEGYVAVVADAGSEGVRLAQALDRRGGTPFVRRALEAARRAAAGQGVVLSERELDIARFLPTRLSSAEIAARLYVSGNTLKTHLRAIYRKLGVNDRGAAAERVVQLGLG